MKGVCFLLTSYLVGIIICTVDISLPELEYLANHLTSDECWKLVVVLHSNKFEEIEFSHKLEQPVITQINCLEDLLHWNSLPGEGFDETHQILALKLRQIGRSDLSDWLSQTVFAELAKDLNKTLLSDPFKEVPKSSNKTDLDIIGPKERIDSDHDLWKPFDTILTAITFSLLFIFIWVTYKILKITYLQKKEKKQTIRKSKAYESLPLVYQDQDEERSEEEESTIYSDDQQRLLYQYNK